MYYEKQGPHMRVFDGTDGKLYYLTKHRNNKTTFHIEKSPGSIVVSLCETDFTEYKNKINELKEIPYSFDKFESLKKQVWNICDMLKPLNEKIYFFTHNSIYLIFDKLINIKHPSDLFVLDEIYKKDIATAIETLEEVLVLQEIFKFAINLCLDKENLPKRHVSEKLVGFLFEYKQFNNFFARFGFALMPNKNGKLDYEKVKYLNDNNINDTKEQLDFMHKSEQHLSLMTYTIIDYLHELIYFEFMHMLKRGRQVKVCKNCGRYFVLEDKRKREYCYRIYKDGKTCKEVGHTNTYKKSLGGEDSPLKIGQRLYNKLFSRMDRARNKLSEQLTDKDMTEEEFFEWSKIYSSAKADYKKSIITGEEFIKKIWRD